MACIYGLSPVLEALKSGKRQIDRILIAEGSRLARLQEVLERARRAGIPVRREPRRVLDNLAGGKSHQGVVAVVAAAGYKNEQDLLDHITPRSIYLLLDGVEDPRNLGAILRTAECAGVDAVVIPERRAAHLTDTVAKTAAGAVEYLPVARVGNLVAFIEALKHRGMWVIGIEREGQKTYTEYEYAGPTALVFGSEGHGLHRLVRERCDLVLSIPMYGRVTSLNVSVAVGVVLFEAVRQRSGTPSGVTAN